MLPSTEGVFVLAQAAFLEAVFFGEKRFDFLLMASSSQSVEPPQNPGRFSGAPLSDINQYVEQQNPPFRSIACWGLTTEIFSLDP
jgi:hypothetical protein